MPTIFAPLSLFRCNGGGGHQGVPRGRRDDLNNRQGIAIFTCGKMASRREIPPFGEISAGLSPACAGYRRINDCIPDSSGNETPEPLSAPALSIDPESKYILIAESRYLLRIHYGSIGRGRSY